MSGDELGQSWTCSILSKLFNEEDVSKYMDEAKDILQMFVHQQHTARILVFAMLLGRCCESIARESALFIKALRSIVDEDPAKLIRSLEGKKSEIVRERLKNLVWGLDTVSAFNNTFSESLEEIREAEEKITMVLKKVRSLEAVPPSFVELMVLTYFNYRARSFATWI
jgi:hypothetical protein